jgi:hypothetical protein
MGIFSTVFRILSYLAVVANWWWFLFWESFQTNATQVPGQNQPTTCIFDRTPPNHQSQDVS